MWYRFLQNFKQDLKFWVALIVLQQMFRVYYIWTLRAYLESSNTISDYLLTIVTGLRFDAKWTTLATLVLLFLVTIPATIFKRLDQSSYPRIFRKSIFILSSFICIVAYVVSIEYYREYHDTFNQFLFGLIYDDRTSIFQTIWAQDYIFKYTLTFIASIFAATYISKLLFPVKHHQEQKIYKRKHWLTSCTLFIIISMFYVGGFRGGFGARPIQLKDAAVARDAFLNKTTMLPFNSLRYAIKDHSAITASDYGTQFLAEESISSLLERKFNNPTALDDFDSYTKTAAKGDLAIQKVPKARHVFIIVGESYDYWPTKDEYADLQLTNNLKRIANQGIFISNFVSGSCSTIGSLNTIISGLQETGSQINYRVNSMDPYPTAAARHFKKLGYSTNFYYGGYLSWQKVGDFAVNQGFDHAYGAAHMGSWVRNTEWGVDDKDLFNFILESINDEEPTFNVIMTTSYHPPYSVDLRAEGYDLEQLEEKLQPYPNAPASAKQLAHLWYADKCVGDFVRKVENKFTLSLFAITGDHYSRRHVLPNPPLDETLKVPFVLYGKGITDHITVPQDVAGSHLDIVPTLVEMVAPAGFAYNTMGSDLLDRNVDFIGTSMDYIVNAKYGAFVASRAPLEMQAAIDKHKLNYVLSWWRVAKGNKLQDD